MENLNFADLDGSLRETPPELVGMYPLGGGGLLEAPYRHYFEWQHFKSIIRLAKHMNVLELGSGNGRWAVAMAPLVQSYTGVDVTPRAVSIAQQAVKDRGFENCSFHEASILDFHASGKTYDLVYFSGVSQYLQDEQLRNVIGNLECAIGENAVIVDRSTVNYGWREVVERPDYFSILRTPEELEQIMGEYGFTMTYTKRSYRFLRGARLLQRLPFTTLMSKAINTSKPISLYAMLGASFLADCVRPKHTPDGTWDHIFLRFNRVK